MFSPVSFVNINFVMGRFFYRVVRSKSIKASFFAKSSFLKKEVDVIIGEIFLGINK